MLQLTGPRPRPLLSGQLTPLPRNPREYPHIPYTFYRWPLCLSSFKFFWWAPEKLFYFFKSDVSVEVVQGRWFWSNYWKRVCDFLSVHHSNHGHISHRFGDIAGFLCSWPHPIPSQFWGCSRCTRSPMLGSALTQALRYSAVKLFSKNSNLCDHGS